ncbi:hypothetical protein JTB14_030041 [Gonioctena quinquepunctata]|nr:hypothetical protein JTB14_030041 [Gonioctena quinquepunctata]
MKWAQQAPVRGREQAENIHTILPGLKGPTRENPPSESPLQAWRLIISDDILAEIVINTNKKIECSVFKSGPFELLCSVVWKYYEICEAYAAKFVKMYAKFFAACKKFKEAQTPTPTESPPLFPKEKKGGVSGINPISVLNELKAGLEYKIIDKSGPSHNPTFKVCVEVDGQNYYGNGKSKKSAKTVVASEALKSFKIPTNGMIFSTNTISASKLDSKRDRAIVKNKGGNKQSSNNQNAKGHRMLPNELYLNADSTCSFKEKYPYARFKTNIIHGKYFKETGEYQQIVAANKCEMLISLLFGFAL